MANVLFPPKLAVWLCLWRDSHGAIRAEIQADGRAGAEPEAIPTVADNRAERACVGECRNGAWLNYESRSRAA